MKIPWDFFARRRGYNLPQMLEQGQFTSYDDYTRWCDNKDVTPLAENQFKLLQPPPQKPDVKETKKKTVKKKDKIEDVKEIKQGESDSGNQPKSKTGTRRHRTPAVKKS